MAETKVTTMDEFIIRAKQEMKRKGINQSKLAEITGVPKSTLGKILCSTTKYPQKATIEALAKGLDIDISEIDAYKSNIPHNRFNPLVYFTKEEFDTYINESIEKVNQAKQQLDDILGLLLTIQQGTIANERLQKEVEEEIK